MIVDDDQLAHDLAGQAGKRLLDLRGRAGFSSRDALRAAGDLLSHRHITAALAAHRPGDAVLSEEGRDDPARLAAGRVWIVDPLDGTREFGEPGRSDWAVHVALWERGGPHGRLSAGAVALPAQARIFSTVTSGAVGGTGPPAADGLRIVASRTRAPELVRRVAAHTGAEVMPLGSAGAKIIAVVTGAADAYIHANGQYEWDSAAPVAVAQAAGLHTSRIDGRPLVYNQPDPRLPDILVCRPGIAEMLLAAIRCAGAAEPPVA